MSSDDNLRLPDKMCQQCLQPGFEYEQGWTRTSVVGAKIRTWLCVRCEDRRVMVTKYRAEVKKRERLRLKRLYG